MRPVSCDARRTAIAGAGPRTNNVARSWSRRGSTATAAARPMASAIQAARPNVKYRVGSRTTRSCCAGRAASGGARPRREAERDQRSHCREESQSIPVADWLCQPVDGRPVVDPDPVGDEAGQKAEGRDERDRREQSAEDAARKAATREQQDGGSRGDIDEAALDLENALCRCDGPGDRERNPPDERHEGREKDALIGVQPDLSANEKRDRGRPEKWNARPTPGGRGSSRPERPRDRAQARTRRAPATMGRPTAARRLPSRTRKERTASTFTAGLPQRTSARR